jgi:hypothetical protein
VQIPKAESYTVAVKVVWIDAASMKSTKTNEPFVTVVEDGDMIEATGLAVNTTGLPGVPM